MKPARLLGAALCCVAFLALVSAEPRYAYERASTPSTRASKESFANRLARLIKAAAPSAEDVQVKPAREPQAASNGVVYQPFILESSNVRSYMQVRFDERNGNGTAEATHTHFGFVSCMRAGGEHASEHERRRGAPDPRYRSQRLG
jgi:hypothetical protein